MFSLQIPQCNMDRGQHKSDSQSDSPSKATSSVAGQIYPADQQIILISKPPPLIDFDLTMAYGIASKTYEKFDDFNFKTVYFPILVKNVPNQLPMFLFIYKLYISLLIRFARICSNISDFNNIISFDCLITKKRLRRIVRCKSKTFIYHLEENKLLYFVYEAASILPKQKLKDKFIYNLSYN